MDIRAGSVGDEGAELWREKFARREFTITSVMLSQGSYRAQGSAAGVRDLHSSLLE